MAAPSATPNLDACEKQLTQLAPAQAQVLLLRAGFLDLAILLRDNRKLLEDLNRNLQRANRTNEQAS